MAYLLDQSQIEWLKTSIAGIILLGAIGSVVAVVLLKSVAFLAGRLLPPAKSSLLRIAFGFFRGPALIVEHLKSSQDPREVLVTIMLFLALQILTCAGIVTGTVLSAIGAIAPAENVSFANMLVFYGSLMTCLNMFFFILCMRHMFAIYMIYMGHAESSAKKRIADMSKASVG